jgi:hypothetical protein
MDQIYIFIALALLLCFILFKEIKRANKSNLNLRILASLLAVTALFFIASPIKFNRQTTKDQKNSVILLTEAYQKDSLAAWKGLSIFSTDKKIIEKNKNAIFIADLHHFLRSKPNIQSFHIFGYGLESHELEILKGKKLIFHPSTLADGIRSINWSKTIRSGEELLIQGNYVNTQKREIKLVLKGLGTNLDSVIIEDEKSDFELKHIPKHLDKALYSLITLANGDTISIEDLPVFVKKPEPLRILILASSPDFEYKFLKKWLSEQEYNLATRITISTNKFNTEFINSRKTSLSRINPTLLNNFDVLIGDIQELSRLSSSENQAIQNQVNKGMGLIIKADAIELGKNFYGKAFRLLESKKAIPNTMNLMWNGKNTTKNILKGSTFLSIMPQAGTQSLVKNEAGDILINSKLFGKGRIILSLINDSYTWALGNQMKDYSSFWTYILQKVGKEKEMAKSYTFPKIPLVNTEIVIQSDSSGLEINKDTVALLQDPTIQFEYRGSWWPRNIGWQSIDNDTEWLYIFGESAWMGVRASEKLSNTQKSLKEEIRNSEEEKIAHQSYEDRINPFWFYILFLFCCLYLWLEVKLS